jgi:hypothetical protein
MAAPRCLRGVHNRQRHGQFGANTALGQFLRDVGVWSQSGRSGARVIVGGDQRRKVRSGAMRLFEPKTLTHTRKFRHRLPIC